MQMAQFKPIFVELIIFDFGLLCFKANKTKLDQALQCNMLCHKYLAYYTTTFKTKLKS